MHEDVTSQAEVALKLALDEAKKATNVKQLDIAEDRVQEAIEAIFYSLELKFGLEDGESEIADVW